MRHSFCWPYSMGCCWLQSQLWAVALRSIAGVSEQRQMLMRYSACKPIWRLGTSLDRTFEHVCRRKGVPSAPYVPVEGAFIGLGNSDKVYPQSFERHAKQQLCGYCCQTAGCYYSIDLKARLVLLEAILCYRTQASTVRPRRSHLRTFGT